MSIQKTVDDPQPESGDTITYTIVVSNTGDTAAIGALVTDAVPSGLTYLLGSATLDSPATGTVGAPPQVATGLIISSGQRLTLTLQATVNSALADYLTITNTAEVAAENVVSTHSDSAIITIMPPPDPAEVCMLPAGSRIYATNPHHDTVTVINAFTFEIVKSIPVGDLPIDVVLAPGGTRAYVTNRDSDNVTAIDTQLDVATGTVIPVGSRPEGAAINPAGTRLYVANHANGGAGSVSVIDTATDSVIATIPLGSGSGPTGVIVHPNGAKVYVANVGTGGSPGSTVSVIDAATNTVIDTVTVSTAPANFALTPDGQFLYVSNEASNDLVVIDTATDTVTGSPIPVEAGPTGMVVTPDGQRLYVSNAGPEVFSLPGGVLNKVSILDLTTVPNSVIKTLTVGQLPNGTISTPDGACVFVANGHGDSVSVIGTALEAVIGDIPAGPLPLKIALKVATSTDLSSRSADIHFDPAAPAVNESVTISATVHNSGLSDVANVEVDFLDFGSLIGRVTIPSLAAGASAEVSVQTSFGDAGVRLISVQVDPDDAIAELDEANNEASKVLQVGQPDPSQATMVIQPSAPSVCQGESASISGQAHYDFSQVPGTDDYPVQGGAVKVVIIDPATGNPISTFTGALTNINGFFSQGILAPASDGVYPVRVEVTDKTITQETQTTLTVSGACPEPPTVPPPTNDPGPGTPPPSAPPNTPPSEAFGDVYVRSEDIFFSDDNPDPGEGIMIFAYIRYYGGEPAFDIPVTLYDIVPINGTLTFIEIGNALVDFPDGGSSSPVVVTVPWTANPEGAQVIQVVVEPPFDQFTGNDKAARLIVVGDVPLLAIQKEVTLLVDADSDGVISPGDRLLYTISYQNNGTGDAVTATLIDDFDESLLLTPNPISDGGTVANGVITWNLGTLGPQASGSVTYEAEIVSAAEFPTGRTVIENVALLTADDAPTAADSAEVEVVVNSPPTVDAGPDQTVDEGDTISLSATGNDYDGDPLTYAWDLDGDGSFETGGQNTSFITDDGPETITVTARVSDTSGLSATDQLVIEIRNVPPTATLGVPSSVNAGDDIALALTDPSDPSSADTAAGFEYSFDCGAGYGGWSGDNSALCPTTIGGTITVKGRIRDKDGGATEYTADVAISSDEVFLGIEKTVDDANPRTGDTISYTVVVSNSGATDATGAVISDIIPAGLTYVVNSASLSPAGAGTVGEPPHLATGLTVTAGQSVTLSFQVTVNDGLEDGLIVTNTAQVTSTGTVSTHADSAAIVVKSLEHEDITLELVLTGMAITGFTPGSGYEVGILDWVWTIQSPNLERITDVFFDVILLEPTAVAIVINADGGPAGQGARLSVSNDDLPGGNGILDRNESFDQLFQIGWDQYASFTFQVRAYGVVLEAGSVAAGEGAGEPQLLGDFTVEFDPSTVDTNQPEDGEPKNKVFAPLITR